jgi:hypothetical protein
LKEVYTQLSPKDVLEQRWIFSGLFGDAMATNEPLSRTLQRYVTPELVQAIATEYQRGRLLLIAITDLDVGRPVIWDIGKIAASRNRGAMGLIQKLMLASAAIPMAFPPVTIDVEADGKQYQEMNVDGGASAQVFVYPPGLRINQMGITRKRILYVIRNARLDPEWADVNRQTLSIAGRAATSLIQTQGISDLYRIDVKLRYAFDPEYMTALFQVRYDMGRAGYSWPKVPPGFGEVGKACSEAEAVTGVRTAAGWSAAGWDAGVKYAWSCLHCACNPRCLRAFLPM